jgi:1,4-dihydroxy-2-naphthoate octaprenyltransferase
VSLETAILIALGWLAVSIALAFFQAWKSWWSLKALSVLGLVAGIFYTVDERSTYSLATLLFIGFYAIPIGLVIGAVFWMSYRFGNWRVKKKAV